MHFKLSDWCTLPSVYLPACPLKKGRLAYNLFLPRHPYRAIPTSILPNSKHVIHCQFTIHYAITCKINQQNTARMFPFIAAFLIWLVLFLLKLLGFGPLGPIAGSVAASWQTWHGAAVPAGGLFAWLQRIAMTWAI
ncbi:hypothetical protein LZ32DRAFT_461525 [Colletotrichum eremochloae]|nr:hypothetical protein LZ32DRAFT_461525 [Colletotrichum eremochloae]